MEGSHDKAPTAYETLTRLSAGLIPDADITAGCSPVAADRVPAPFHELLVHREHMTKRLERFYGRAVELRVLAAELVGDAYRRKIALVPTGSDIPVEVGIARVELRFTPPAVRAEILEQRAPLGDILIRHDVLRTIEPRWFLRFDARGSLARSFGLSAMAPGSSPTDGTFYGRLGVIHCNGEPAIELLEIVTGAASATGI